MSKTIIIDAGHGGTDPGAVWFGINEKDWALKMSLFQYKRLKELGAKVYMTRETDHSLNPIQRVARIKNQYSICISNHWNAFNGEARGVETIHSVHAKPDFAKELADAIAKVTGLPLRRVFSREIKKDVDYYFMHRLSGKTETVIIEYGFIDNALDHNRYKQEDLFFLAGEVVVKCICRKIGIRYFKPVEREEVRGINTPMDSVEPVSVYIGKRVESIHDGMLRFYTKASWADADVYGYLRKGLGFPSIIEKVTVGKGEQFKVKNSAGRVFYVTASPTYVKVI